MQLFNIFHEENRDNPGFFRDGLASEISISEKETNTSFEWLYTSERKNHLSQASASVARETGEKPREIRVSKVAGWPPLLRSTRIQVSETRVTEMLEHYFKDVIKIAPRYTRR